ncbi:hypothetical protein HNP55_002555 [Paucibacter oligotrophus]|uniref:Uncharacterized protein n=1 Tax=Roseateles oligotrophus TaxID=1769250 RepID=A0A840LD74_9BURK|nr:hypothetical protein [Roseateles oligotrophus]MBB4844019.1 hypothetical protein [Roseateles oligotrophus]
MSLISRRSFLTVSVAGQALGLAACGGGSAGSPPAPAPLPAPAPAPVPPAPIPPPTATPAPPPAAADWNLGPALYLVANGQVSLDLATSLPSGYAKGGVFGVDASGTPLPAGLTLTPAGLLSAEPGASLGSLAGLVFSYQEP